MNTHKEISMKHLKLISLAVVCAGLSSQVQATPKLISAMGNGATTYSLFIVDTAKALKNGFTVVQAQTALQTELNLNTSQPKLTACFVAGDLNITPVNCGNGALQFRNADFYTYNIPSNIPIYPMSKTLKSLFLETQGANFKSSTTNAVGQIIPGDTSGRVVNIHFKQRVAQFGLLVDAGQTAAPSVSGIQFLVNRQITEVQTLTAGVPTFVGVEDTAGFTDVTIISSGEIGSTTDVRAWIADHFSFVPLATF
jgi:hypothetical protein